MSETTTVTCKPKGIGDPTPLGLAALGISIGLLSFHTSGLVKEAALGAVAGVVGVVFGGVVTLLVALLQYVRGDKVGATFFGVISAFWLTTCGVHAAGASGDAHLAFGLYFLSWALVALFLALKALKTKGVTLLTTGALTLTFLFLALGQFQNHAAPDSLTKVGGWLGLLTAGLALYGAFAGITAGEE